MRPNTWLAAVILAFAAGACGAPSGAPVPASEDDRAWHVPRRGPARRRSLFRSETVPNRLPETRHASRDGEDVERVGLPRMVFNVFPDGSLYFKGMTWPLPTDDPEERDESLLALRDELELLTANPDWRDPEGRSRLAVTLAVVREAPWRHVPDLVRVVREPTIRIRRIQWAVRRRTLPGGWRHGGILTPLPAVGTGPAPLRVALDGRAAGDTTEVTLAVGDRTWSFGVGEIDYGDAETVERANAVWAEAQEALAGTRARHDRASLTLPEPAPGVTWGHVVTAFDLLIGAGYRVVDLPVQGWRLELEEPDPLPPEPRDDPIVTPLSVLAVVLGLFLGVFVTLWPLRGRARRADSGRARS